MKKKRPVAVIIIAIFHFIFGGCCSVAALAQVTGLTDQFQNAMAEMSAKSNPKQAVLQKKMQSEMETRISGYAVMLTAGGFVSFAFSLLLLLGGIGLITMQSWGRWLSIFYGFASLLWHLVGAIFNIVVVLPAMNQILQDVFAREDPAFVQVMQFSVNIGTPIGLCFTFIYPVVVLIVMFLPHVGRAFKASPADDSPIHDDAGDYDRARHYE